MADPDQTYRCPQCGHPLEPGIDTTCPNCTTPIEPRTLDQPAAAPELVPFFGDMVTREFKERRDQVVAEHIAEARRLLNQPRTTESVG